MSFSDNCSYLHKSLMWEILNRALQHPHPLVLAENLLLKWWFEVTSKDSLHWSLRSLLCFCGNCCWLV